jgi:hypothetical protein
VSRRRAEQTLEQHRPQRLDQWLQAHTASTDPLRERRARYGHTSSFEDALLPIEWLVIRVFRHSTRASSPAVGSPLSIACARTGARIKVWHFAHAHLPRMCRSTWTTPGR